MDVALRIPSFALPHGLKLIRAKDALYDELFNLDLLSQASYRAWLFYASRSKMCRLRSLFVARRNFMLVSSDFKLSKSPAFIAFEGINGCGKTTLHRLLSEKLRSHGKQVRDTREPGGTQLGSQLRKLLLEWEGEPKSYRSELLLFAADRAEHVDKVIRPNLATGNWVLTDRYIYSTISFQGYGRGLDRSFIDAANDLAVQGTLPDLVILLDLSPEEAFKRIAQRASAAHDAFEDEALAFHARIREGFLECARESSVPFLLLDATHTPEELLARAAKACGLS